ncbi:MAG: DUF3604 domain-containing protein [Porticoccaceae bacterium]|nr:DUF3604 domain-containing protein [Porticoccaceae bacterium]
MLCMGKMMATLCAVATIQVASQVWAEEPVLLWGDTHVHTSYSFDAYMFGNATGDPDAAYRFAKGLPVINPGTGAWVRLELPLDFLVVADHAEMLGVSRMVGQGEPAFLDHPIGQKAYKYLKEGNTKEAYKAMSEAMFTSDPDIKAVFDSKAVKQRNWNDIVDAADKYNEPGQFSAIVGWEYTSHSNNSNLHRVVFTAAGGETAKSFLPFSAMQSAKPEDLWAYLDSTVQQTGVDFVAIPHNSNVSKGKMFNTVDSNGKPIDKAYAEIRARWEPVVEITQAKGNSETHGNLSPNDEFATYEFYPSLLAWPEEPTVTAADYVRPALLRGLEIEKKVGVNPYKFGVIGSTDSHTSLSSSEEDAFYGKVVADAKPETRGGGLANSGATGWDAAAAGRAAVWAKNNSREEILAAFKRREVYGTTGPRIALRVFGGFNFADRDAKTKNIAAVGYKKGVPMGGDLTQAPQGRAPSLLIHAVKDPNEANLDRIQVVKGWLGDDDKSHEKVYEVAWAGDRKLDAHGKLPSVGSTVDAKTGRYSNTIGAAQLATVWTDPDFDPKQRAFYYVRILQIPTPRNTLFDTLALEVDPVATTGHPAMIEERAYSSSIWYNP